MAWSHESQHIEISLQAHRTELSASKSAARSECCTMRHHELPHVTELVVLRPQGSTVLFLRIPGGAFRPTLMIGAGPQ